MEGVLNQLFVIIYLRGMDDCLSVFCYLDISSAVRIIYSVSARISLLHLHSSHCLGTVMISASRVRWR